MTPDIQWISSSSHNLQTCIDFLSTCVAWNSCDKLVTTMSSFSRRCINRAIWISFPRCHVQMLTFGVVFFFLLSLSFRWPEFNISLRTVNCGAVNICSDSHILNHLLVISVTPSGGTIGSNYSWRIHCLLDSLREWCTALSALCCSTFTTGTNCFGLYANRVIGLFRRWSGAHNKGHISAQSQLLKCNLMKLQTKPKDKAPLKSWFWFQALGKKLK